MYIPNNFYVHHFVRTFTYQYFKETIFVIICSLPLFLSAHYISLTAGSEILKNTIKTNGAAATANKRNGNWGLTYA